MGPRIFVGGYQALCESIQPLPLQCYRLHQTH